MRFSQLSRCLDPETRSFRARRYSSPSRIFLFFLRPSFARSLASPSTEHGLRSASHTPHRPRSATRIILCSVALRRTNFCVRWNSQKELGLTHRATRIKVTLHFALISVLPFEDHGPMQADRALNSTNPQTGELALTPASDASEQAMSGGSQLQLLMTTCHPSRT